MSLHSNTTPKLKSPIKMYLKLPKNSLNIDPHNFVTCGKSQKPTSTFTVEKIVNQVTDILKIADLSQRKVKTSLFIPETSTHRLQPWIQYSQRCHTTGYNKWTV
jgi:hypothetical protein